MSTSDCLFRKVWFHVQRLHRGEFKHISISIVNLYRCITNKANMTAIESADIAVVSFDRFINGTDAGKHQVAKELYHAFSTVGWVYLKDHGIPQSKVDEIFQLVSSPVTHTQLCLDLA